MVIKTRLDRIDSIYTKNIEEYTADNIFRKFFIFIQASLRMEAYVSCPKFESVIGC